MKIKIVIHQPHKAVEIAVPAHYENDKGLIRGYVYTGLTHRGVAAREAMDAADWSATAENGDSYNAEGFDVYIDGEKEEEAW